MKKLEKFYRITNIGIVSVLLIFEGKVRDLIHAPEVVGYVATIAILIMLFKLLEWVIELFVERTIWLRRLILGDEYLEGVWCDKITIDDKFCYAILTITLDNEMYYINGSQFYIDGTLQHTWNTLASKYDDHIIRFLYHSTYYDNSDDDPYGYCIYCFEKKNLHHFPTTYNGKYKDIGKDQIERPFVGYKILRKDILKKLKAPEKHIETFREIVQFYFGE